MTFKGPELDTKTTPCINKRKTPVTIMQTFLYNRQVFSEYICGKQFACLTIQSGMYFDGQQHP